MNKSRLLGDVCTYITFLSSNFLSYVVPKIVGFPYKRLEEKTMRNFIRSSLLALCAVTALHYSTATFAIVVDTVTVTVDSVDYDITTLTGIFNDNATLLQSQPWWGNASAATSFASAVNSQLGMPNTDVTGGPWFAHALDTSPNFAIAKIWKSTGVTTGYPDTYLTTRTWAVVVSQVPVPAAAWLFGSGLLGLIGIARKKVS